MKRTLYLALLAAMVSAGAAQATEKHLSVGAFGGFSIPVLQDVDASSFSPSDAFGPTGSQFGLRADVKVIPVVTLEPFFAKSSHKEQEETFGTLTYTREGFDGTAFGLNAILGRPDVGKFKVFPYVGLGKFKLERAGQDINEVGWNFGLGFGISPAERFSIQIRSELNMVVTGDTSRKFGNMNVGLNYAILP